MAGVVDRRARYDEVAQALADAQLSVVVGIRQGDGGGDAVRTVGPPGARRSVAGSSGDPTLAEVAAANEFGTGTVPERSFMRTTFDSLEPEYEVIVRDGVGQAIDGRDSLHTVLGVVGARMASDIQQSIVELESPPNSPATIERKGSSNPLIDTGRMRQAIGFEIRGGRR